MVTSGVAVHSVFEHAKMHCGDKVGECSVRVFTTGPARNSPDLKPWNTIGEDGESKARITLTGTAQVSITDFNRDT